MTFTNQSIQFGSLFLDGTSGTLAMTSNADYGWDLWADSGSGATFLSPSNNHGVAVDWGSSPLAVSTIWLSTSSTQNTWYQPPQVLNGVTFIPEMFLTGVGQNGGIAMLQPNGSGGIVMGPCFSTFSLVAPVSPPPPAGSTTDATIIPNLPVTGLQGAWAPTVQQFDSDYWLGQLQRPDVDSAGNQNCVMMTNGIGIQGSWSQYDADAYTSGQILLGSKSISQPNAPQWVAIPLGAIPPSDSTSPTLAQAGTGSFNTHYQNAADQFGGMQNRAIWRLMWEGIAANNTWYPWGYTGQTTYASDFVAAWNAMAATVLPIIPGELCWNLNQDFLNCPVWQQCWPTGIYQPSIIGVDIYYQGWMGAVGSDGGTGVFNQYHLPGLQAAAAFARQQNVRFAIPEWGIQNGDAPGWVTALGQFINSLSGETVIINKQTLPLFVYAGAYLVGTDSIGVGCPNALAVFEQPPFAL